MKNLLFKKIKNILKQLDLKKGPLLLGLSGGADSTFLLHMLLMCKKDIEFDLHVAYVDHGWREDSKNERNLLKKLSEDLSIPFHSTVLKYDNNVKNLEEVSRNLRLEYFEDLFNKHSFSFLVLAHHADDVCETVLKRIFEGSELFNIGGMKSVSKYKSMTVLRPMLNITKKQILKWLHENDVSYFHDITNDDTKFLRARMRKDIIPYLNDTFKKDITENLLEASIRSYELKYYLDKKTEHIKNKIQSGPFGIYIDFSDVEFVELEIRHVIKGILINENIDVSRKLLSQYLLWIENGEANKKSQLKNANIFIDRKKIFIIRKNIPEFKDFINIKLGMHKSEDWTIKITKINKKDAYNSSNWTDLWKGKAKYLLPYIEGAKLQVVSNKHLSSWLSKCKIPSFLKNFFPVLVRENYIYAEFLSGKNWKNIKNDNFVEVSFEFNQKSFS